MKYDKKLVKAFCLTTLAVAFALPFAVVMLDNVYDNQIPMLIRIILFTAFPIGGFYMISTFDRKSKLKSIISLIVFAFLAANVTHFLFLLAGFQETYSPLTISQWTLNNIIIIPAALYGAKLTKKK